MARDRLYLDHAATTPYDKIASVGMFEHVGRAHMAEYFGKAFELQQKLGPIFDVTMDCEDGAPTVPLSAAPPSRS